MFSYIHLSKWAHISHPYNFYREIVEKVDNVIRLLTELKHEH